MSEPTENQASDGDSLEQQYSPSSAIGGDYRPFIDRYWRSSAEARASVEHHEGLSYGPGRHETLDLFPGPRPSDGAGLLVYIHGGYWQELSKDASSFAAPAWHGQGFAYCSVGYPLVTQMDTPSLGAIVESCIRALHWLHDSASTFGYGPERIVVAGSSAGAYLTAAVGAAANAPSLLGMVPISGVYDLHPLIGTSINDAVGLDDALANQLDLSRRAAEFCPTVVAWGEVETDEFKRQSREFAAHLRSLGQPCTELEVAGRNHFDIVFELADSDSELFALTRRLFAS